MASARPASSLRQEDQSAVPNINAQQHQRGGLDYHWGDAAFLSHSYDNDILFIYIFLDDSTITFRVPDYSLNNHPACLHLHAALNPIAQDDLDPLTIMSDHDSLTTAVRHGVTATLDELKLNQHVSLRKVRDAYWVGLAQVIVKTAQYKGVEPYIRSDMFEKTLKSAIENSSGLNAYQQCNYELLSSSLTLDNELHERMWKAQE